ncbi:TIGR02186 family protein [Pelagibacterium lentulum]|uniref:TIGR02186 family protein n=1 Tax=Pelagibacterium lentulum TaxID=2029865 RepID=UPI000F8CCF8E|nr:TIGR02186 family protein [Pelagibacterium lentulum]
MSLLRVILIAMATLLLATGQGAAQGVVFANSDPLVTIHSNFTGQAVTLFGNIEPSGIADPAAPMDVIVLVRGPASDRIVRVQERQFGIMLNTAYAVYRRLPGYFAVLSSRPIEEIVEPEILADPRMSLSGIANQAMQQGNAGRFTPELVRLMRNSGLFTHNPRGVSFLSPTTFAARVVLPAAVPNGTFVAHALVVQNGEITAQATSRFIVRTEGFERFLANAARNHPFLYGLAAIAIAIATGWLGGVLFRR